MDKIDKRLIILGGIIIVLIISIILFLNLSNQNSVDSTSTIAHATYDNGLVSFNYPEGWNILPNQTQEVIVAIGDPTSKENSTGLINTYFTLIKEPLPSGQNLKDTFDATYSQLKNQDSSYQPISNQTITINGKTVYENVFRKTVSNIQKQERSIWLEKSGIIYILTFSTLPDGFEKNKENFELIINSFQIK